jgi:hypothetical protein
VVQRRGLVLGVLASVAVAGCGGGSSASKSNAGSSAPKPTTKAEFIAKANALCTKGKKVEPSEAQIIALLSSVPLQRAHTAAVLRGASKEVQKISGEIAALPRPAGDTAAIAKWLSQASHVGVLVGQLGDAVANRDDAAMSTAEADIITATGDPLNFAATYGLTACDSF